MGRATNPLSRARGLAARLACLPCLLAPAVLASSDARAHALGEVRMCIETPLVAALRPARVAAWAERLEAVEVENAGTPSPVAAIRLYGSDGEIDPAALGEFERAAARDDDPHPLAARVVQLVFKAAYHFGGPRVVVVSGWRAHAGKHGTNEAVDFKLRGVRASRLAAYLRGLPRAGVGVYTHPRTQYVHLDVREPSFHWIDASPPGVKWREGPIWDRGAEKRDASWTPEMDLPGGTP
jgi:uncharacterized protein YcbK (DUF882 family)